MADHGSGIADRGNYESRGNLEKEQVCSRITGERDQGYESRYYHKKRQGVFRGKKPIALRSVRGKSSKSALKKT